MSECSLTYYVPVTPRAPSMTPADRRRAILEAVVPLLVEYGGDLTTRRIAEAAGVAEGTLFRVFPDKAALMLAAAEHVMAPPGGAEEFSRSLDGVDDLRDRVRLTTDRMIAAMARISPVLMAIRGHLPKDVGPGSAEGPPEFVRRANRDLLAMLAGVFEPHRDRLRVEPETAALVLRSIVFGAHHPGMDAGATLTPDQIADIVVGGVLTQEGD